MAQPARSSSFARRLVEQGVAALYHEQEEEALGLLTEALRREPADLRARYLVALCAHLLDREELLDDVCLAALRIDRDDPWTRACEAVRFLFLANYSRARELFERAVTALPRAVELHVGLGIVGEYSGEYERAIAAYERALELDPDNVRARVALGSLVAMEGDFEAALDHYTRARLADPDTENPHQRLGRDYYSEGMFELADSEFALAVDEEPDEPTGWFYLLDTLCRLDRFDEALDVYEQIRDRFGDDPELVCGFYEHFNMRGEALRSLRRLAEQRPEDPGILLRLGQACREAGRTGEAARLAERAARLDPDRPETHVMLGELRFDAGRFREAATSCRRAVALNPNSHESWIRLADALLFLGRLEESAAVVAELERIRRRAWEDYQAKFSGQDVGEES
ncbi:tetratricopeptide repeat protein [candidate division WOR-3 bacterium]|nr:tetratricopeptide repeat protein [candidate division WOR-3 bacterium]